MENICRRGGEEVNRGGEKKIRMKRRERKRKNRKVEEAEEKENEKKNVKYGWKTIKGEN